MLGVWVWVVALRAIGPRARALESMWSRFGALEIWNTCSQCFGRGRVAVGILYLLFHVEYSNHIDAVEVRPALQPRRKNCRRGESSEAGKAANFNTKIRFASQRCRDQLSSYCSDLQLPGGTYHKSRQSLQFLTPGTPSATERTRI